ncbi:hypothetical protein ACQBAU_16755 [Propionibacteriaceae bacterium Y2011]
MTTRTTSPVTSRRQLLGITAAGVTAGALGVAATPTRARAAVPDLDLDEFIEEQVDYIAGKQLPSGALRGPYDHNLQPYFSNWATQGLAAANTARSREVLGGYISWQLDHLNTAAEDPYGVPGTTSIWHYDEATGEETNTGETPATDAQTTVPMITAHDAFRTGDRDLQHLIMENLDKYALMARATTEAQWGVREPDHLCWARPVLKMKYVQDNGVVVRGLRKLAWLMRRAGRGQEGQFYAQKAEQTRQAIVDVLWHEERKNWAWGHGQTLLKESEPHETFMPDAWCQYWQVQLDVVKPQDRMSQLAWQAFTDACPRWMYNEIDNSFPHTEMAYAAVLMREPENAVRLLQTCKEKFSANGWGALPWYHGEAGHSLRTARALIDSGYGRGR